MNAPHYKCIVADPPWPMALAGKRQRAKGAVRGALPYSTMTVEAIAALKVSDLAAPGAHLWLWTTNSHLEHGFSVLRAWGFKYLAPIHWIKPSGVGNWFVHRSQTILFGYRERCEFKRRRYAPNLLTTGDPVRHSQKPEEFFALVEQVSDEPRLELFARQRRLGWHSWGDEISSDVGLS